jgi:protease-4
MDNCPNIYKLLGVTDYRDIASDISLAKELGAKGIILTVDSGGGEAMGTRECEKAISDCGLPVVAFGDSLMCSAAYKLSVCADYIVARESCQSGNIGVVLTYQDVSGMLNSIGVVQHTLTNEGASYKSIGHRADFADNEQEQFLQDSINRMGEDFWNHVVENRPNIDSECRKAGWYDGDTALELGVIDELGDLETAKERLLELIAITNVIVN